MSFLSPGERRFLGALDKQPLPAELVEPFYATEGDVVRLFMETFDGHLRDVPQPQRALRPGETEQERQELQRRQEHRDFGRKAFGWE